MKNRKRPTPPPTPKKQPKPQIKRDYSKLLTRLIDHLEILIELSNKAFYKYEYEKYIGEVVAKLRVLVIKTKTNKPLLIDLMYHFEYERIWDSVTPGTKLTLRTYMYRLAIYAKDDYAFTNEKFIRFLSQQLGGSHEDWEIDEELYKFLYKSNSKSCDTPYYVYLTRGIVNVVLKEAVQFLLYLHEENILNKLNVKYDYRQILNIDTHYHHALDWNLESRKSKGIDKQVKPIKEGLDKYNLLYLTGKLHLFKINIQGIVPKEDLRKNGPRDDFWMPKKGELYRVK